MTLRRRLAGWLIVTAALGLAGPAAANESDKREISSYVLTEAGLGKFAKAAQALSAVPGICAHVDVEDGDGDDDTDAATLDQLVAKMNVVPGAQAAIQSAGMTTREYVVFMWSMMESGVSAWALQQPGGKLPPGVQQANVDFYRTHESAMRALGDQDPCGKGEDDDGDE